MYSIINYLLKIGAITGVLALGATIEAQSYEIVWFTIDNGGGISTNELLAVNGSIGQSDASVTTMSGGGYAMTGGFWSLCAIQIPGAPTLKIDYNGTDQISISWEPGAGDWVLQESQLLSPSSWEFSPSGGDNPITLPILQTKKFYRLSRP